MVFFDTVRSSFDFGNGLTGAAYYTNDLGCRRAFYWIAPNGQFYVFDDNDCWKSERIYPGNPDYNYEYAWKNVRYTSTGRRGVMRPFTATCVLDMFEDRRNKSGNWYSLSVELKNGRIVGYDA